MLFHSVFVPFHSLPITLTMCTCNYMVEYHSLLPPFRKITQELEMSEQLVERYWTNIEQTSNEPRTSYTYLKTYSVGKHQQHCRTTKWKTWSSGLYKCTLSRGKSLPWRNVHTSHMHAAFFNCMTSAKCISLNQHRTIYGTELNGNLSMVEHTRNRNFSMSPTVYTSHLVSKCIVLS